MAQQTGVDFVGAGALAVATMQLTQPNGGLYKSWVSNMDEGWTRWLLENYGFDFTTVTDADLRTGDRGQPRGTFKLLFNSILFAGLKQPPATSDDADRSNLKRPLSVGAIVVALAVSGAGVEAQEVDRTQPIRDASRPVDPETAPRPVARAVYTTESIKIDGSLDESAWDAAIPITEFVQS